MNVLGEYVADLALGEDRYRTAVERARTIGRENLDRIDKFIASRKELSWERPRAGLIGFCRLEPPIDGDELSRILLREPYRTFVMPGSAYGYPDHIRVGAGGSGPEGISRGLVKLGECLDALGKERP
jgi:hypothetical protein